MGNGKTLEQVTEVMNARSEGKPTFTILRILHSEKSSDIERILEILSHPQDPNTKLMKATTRPYNGEPYEFQRIIPGDNILSRCKQ